MDEETAIRLVAEEIRNRVYESEVVANHIHQEAAEHAARVIIKLLS